MFTGGLGLRAASNAKEIPSPSSPRNNTTRSTTTSPTSPSSYDDHHAFRLRSATIAVEPSSVPVGSSSLPKTIEQMKKEDDERKRKEELLRSMTLEHQKRLEEEERILAEEERKLKEEELKLEQERLRRKAIEDKKTTSTSASASVSISSSASATPVSSSPLPSPSGTIRLDSSAASSLGSSINNSTKQPYTDREREMLLYISELRNTIEFLNKQLQETLEHNRALKQTVEQQVDEIKALKQLQDLHVGSSGNSLKEDKKVEKHKKLKLFGGARSGSKESLSEDSSPPAKKRSQSTSTESTPSHTLRNGICNNLIIYQV
jgi:hypothetical protein